MGNLGYPLDNQSQLIIERAVDKFLSQKVFDANWSEYFYYLTLFEDIENGLGLVDASAGSSGATFAGVVLNTGATSSNETTIGRDLQYMNGTVTYDKASKFRTAFHIFALGDSNPPNSQDIFIGVGVGDSSPAADCYGFRVDNATMYGLTCNGSSETAVELQSVVFDTLYEIEAQFRPGERCAFFVNGKEVGVSTTNLPSGVVSTLPRYSITTNESVAKQIGFSYFEYMQLRDKS